MVQDVLKIITLLLLLHGVSAVITLRPLSSIYLPFNYAGDEAQFGIDVGASEQSGYDAMNKISYSCGDRYIHITDWSNVTSPKIIHRTPTGNICNDVETCGDFVGFVIEGSTKVATGTLRIYSLYDKATGNWTKILDIPIGSKPDMAHFSSDCLTILVANKAIAEANSAHTELVNPEGTISLIRMSSDGSTFNSTLLNFTKFNGRADEYVSRGIRNPYKGELDGGIHTFSQNIEPEYITYNYDETKAFVGLQKNNAMAVVDLINGEIEEIYPLGEKSWINYDLDASDKDDGIFFRRSDIFSFYQPDGIKYFEVDGEGYIITTNEGKKIEYLLSNEEWADTQRGNDFDADEFASTFDENLISNISDNKILGRLLFSTVDGKNDEGKFEKLYFLGSRGFSIFRASNITVIYDSGDDVEKIMARFYPHFFNTNTKPDDASADTPEDFFDKRSDNHGPECESVDIGELDGRRIIFIGVDRTAAILIYSLNPGEVIPTFESVYRAGGFNDTFQDLLDNRNLGDLDPEDLKFIPASTSVTGVPMLLVTNTVSGSLSLYEVYDDMEPTTSGPPSMTTSSAVIPTSSSPVFSLIFFCFFFRSVEF